ncbi:MAG: hypothetical protein U1E66_14625 [Rhodospirillales bacterium]
MLGKCATGELAIGDQFSRTEDAETVWTVQRLVQVPKLPKHAVMTCDKPVPRQILVSEFVLRDRRMYRAVRTVDAAVAPASAEAAVRPRRAWRLGRRLGR